MSSIQMGNDELILYIRKHNSSAKKATRDLGKRIGDWLEANGAKQIKKSEPCRWGSTGPFIASDDLPMTATQFEFDRTLLPALYDFLDTL